MNEKKIFKRFMFRYLIAGLLVLLGSVPFILMAHRQIRNYTISDNVAKLQSGIDELENNFEKMKMISMLISDEQNLRTLRQIEGEISNDKYLNLKYLGKQMFDFKCIYDFSPMFFVLFRDNGAFVSTDQVSDDFAKYYGKFFEVEGMTSEEFKQIIFNKERNSPFIYVEKLQYYITNRERITKNAVLYIQPVENDKSITSNKAAVIFIMDEKKLVETLLNSESAELGLTRITDSEENIIVNYGDKDELLKETDATSKDKYVSDGKDTLRLLTYGNIENGLTITIGFPMSLINEQMKDIIILLFIYLCAGIVIALILTVVFSLHWYTPLRKMLKEVAVVSNNNIHKKNEFDYIKESILKLVSVKDELETKALLADMQKQAIKLENIFIKGFYKKKEENEFLNKHPVMKNGYYVAYFQVKYEVEGEKNHTALVSAMEILKTYLPEGFLHVHSMEDTEILLIPGVNGINKESLVTVFEAMKDEITGCFPVQCHVGISQPEREISNINVAYAHARQTVHAYKNLGTSFIEFYEYMNDREIGCFHIGFLNKLYELILCGGRKEIARMYDEIKVECSWYKEKYELHKAEIFNAISFTNYSAYQQLSFVPKESILLPQYQQNNSLIQSLTILENTAYEICDKIEENKRSKNGELKEKILRYLNSNFKRCELTADIASKEIGISEKYLSTFLKENTGKTLSLYLDELRIGYAKECLETTVWSNDRIAEQSGFGAVNSFYRVFKKYVGVSPSVYKKSKQEL